jgi:hypothetical protein
MDTRAEMRAYPLPHSGESAAVGPQYMQEGHRSADTGGFTHRFEIESGILMMLLDNRNRLDIDVWRCGGCAEADFMLRRSRGDESHQRLRVWPGVFCRRKRP